MTPSAFSTSSQAHRRALPALLLGGVAIGCSPIFVRLSEVGAVPTAFWRLLLALVPLWFMHHRSSSVAKIEAKPKTFADYLAVASPGLFLAAELATWHTSSHMTPVANSTLLVNMTPIFVALISWLFLGQRISRMFLAGLSTSIVGIVVLKGDPSTASGDFRGDIVALTAAVLYAGYILTVGNVRRKYGTLTIMFWSTAAAASSILLFALLVAPHILPWTVAGWIVVIALAWISHVAGQSLIIYALAWLPATFSSLTLLIQPVIAALLAWAFLNEPLTMVQALGGAIVIVGILLARRG